MFSFFSKPAPVVDDNTRAWIFDSFAWAIEHLDSRFFHQETKLILPNNRFYPGRVSSVHEMATNIFNATVNYAGLQQWPIQLVKPENYSPSAIPQLSFVNNENNLRGNTAVVTSALYEAENISLSYQPTQVNQPQDLIAVYAQNLATILVLQQNVAPPGGKEFLPQTIDLVACFLGFGVIFSNTAYQFKGGCGSCNNANLNRQVALPEHETVYVLALFCQLKLIANKQVLPALKPHLHSTFKQALKDIKSYLKQDSHHLALSFTK